MSARNTGGSKSAKNSQGRAPGGAGFTKSGKPRPGTGGYRKSRLEGKGPTPPAEMRTGHPAQRAAVRAAKAAAAGKAAAGKAPAAGQPASRTPAAGGPRARVEQGSQDRRPERRERRDDAPEMVAGRNSVVESLRAQVPAMALYVAGRAQEDERVAEAVQLAAAAGIALLDTSPFELDRLTGNAVHQGVALRIRPYEYAHPEDLLARRPGQAALVVALDGVTDPRNLGAIVRSAAAFGAAGVLVPGRRSAHVTAGAWKASAGALSRLPVAQCSNLTRTIEAYKGKGLFVAGLDAEGSVDVHEMTIADGPMVLVVGSEGRGLSRIVASACDMLVSIPMSSGMESLNAGIAASIALYEIATVRARAAR
ncbi:MAG TPA: 23S rRNA (guanosine(2251)-2'-O)-methyltransferase RlmB [Trebonia sp.]|jgi:23S rRNA (guanosine2251-2'-O)-methyltransferase|nr:23S rRNA (guanosine(2251)-2'-O)-methyltransferase RlmB [Trebonia sp.]